jgi:hypothetical protein
MVLQGTRGLWIGRAAIGSVATLLIGSSVILVPGRLWLLLLPGACIAGCATIVELDRAAKPYTLHLNPSGLTLLTPFRRRSWGWDSYKGIVRVAAPLGEKPLMLKTQNPGRRPRSVMIGKWPAAIEIEIQNYARRSGVNVPALTSLA